MRKLFFAAVAAIVCSCNPEPKTETPPTTDSVAPVAVSLPYPADYSSSFAIGDWKLAEKIEKAWQAWDGGDLMASKDLFADTLHLYMRDGAHIFGARDSALKQAQDFRNTLKNVKSSVHAILPARSTDKNEDWVLIWGKEIWTDKKGKTDSVELQETWRFDNNGKINLLYQFGAMSAAPPPKR